MKNGDYVFTEELVEASKLKNQSDKDRYIGENV